MNEVDSYKQIVKSTSIFTGVQVFNIMINVIRGKVISVLLGTYGVGIYSLLTSTIQFVAGLTNFGLSTSAIRNVAAANETGDKKSIASVIIVLRRIVWLTGLLGSIITLSISPLLSKIAFGNNNYTIAFCWISITLLINQISVGQTVLLQGLRKINYLARSSLSGALLGLFISVPIYYQWGIDGIVPGIIITSIANLARTWYFSRKIKIEKVKVTKQTTISEGKNMLSMGFMLNITGFYVLAKEYGLRAFISHVDSIETVGLFSVGMLILTNYVGAIFTAMSTDYYPRLSAIASDNKKSKDLINQQSVISILLLAPLILLFIVFTKWIIVILFSKDFIAINGMIQWASIGLLFKGASWSIGFILLASGKSKLFLWNELLAGTITFLLQISGYIYGGLTGLGIGIMAGFIYHFFQVFFVAKHYFEFKFEKAYIKILIIQLLLAFLTLILMYFITPNPLTYVICTILFIISSVFSLIELNKRLSIIQLIKNRFR